MVRVRRRKGGSGLDGASLQVLVFRLILAAARPSRSGHTRAGSHAGKVEWVVARGVEGGVVAVAVV